ncbi:BZ3500_MvSof-1268-A1-R1_Chr5-2g07983 [Microbotryum saponariae]|uniref:BZ3500_MvSof-1268-A1-R1_Chr5-2g07983 protein n=1 Tax=Microbotryum saponariae TaxID=289078 RepID=A0A2X0MLD2_9BASI|nr:BZ3500_MvSof-1268-A1-R1_Chr5-2g07983 [Microbotryum saponariae]SDA05852.1 BZ3501_MvSof-1269-A2-R1_Chr5-2g07805 [Microbotryum saponariae]
MRSSILILVASLVATVLGAVVPKLLFTSPRHSPDMLPRPAGSSFCSREENAHPTSSPSI